MRKFVLAVVFLLCTLPVLFAQVQVPRTGGSGGVGGGGAVTSTTATHSNVSASASNVTLLAANASRKGATVYNDSTSTMYLKLAATASSSSFTVKLFSESYYEVPYGYTGIIDAIWVSATGAARVVEFQ